MHPPEAAAPSVGSPVRNGLIRFGYQVLFAVLLVLASPLLVLKMLRRGQWKEGFGQRFGFYPKAWTQELNEADVLWLNAVSVGEVNLTVRLVALLRDRLPETRIVVSTTTSTGMIELRKKLPGDVIKIYYPLDLGSAVRRALGTLRPKAIVLIEADFWPNLLWEAQAADVPLLLVNALVSERSARGYRRFGFLFRPLFASLDRVFCADEIDRKRLESLGCRPEVMAVVGHPKFDTADSVDDHPLDVRGILDQLGLDRSSPILLAGSTHAPEESFLAKSYLALRKTYPELFLVLVPRHFERAGAVADELRAMGIEVFLRTEIPRSPPETAAKPRCLIVNTTGELRYFYPEADIVFIGQSFVEGGGQNPIEPAVHARAILTGPKMETFKAILPEFLARDALIQVPDLDALRASIDQLLAHPEERRAMGRRAKEVVDQNQGALTRTVDGIVANLGTRKARSAPKVI